MGQVCTQCDAQEVNVLATEKVAEDEVDKVPEEEVDTDETLSRTLSKPFVGNGLLEGPYSATDANRRGFFSVLRPPEIGEEVVCFHKKHWLKRGVVESVTEEVSVGQDGLKEGVEGARVTIICQDGQSFSMWAAFLASADDQEYSSICTLQEYETSNFCDLAHADGGCKMSSSRAAEAVPAVRVTKVEARASLKDWLDHMLDADGEAVRVSEATKTELLSIFDAQQDASLHLYSRHTKMMQRTSEEKGRDYSLYYQALNNTLNHDTAESLRLAMPLIRRMTYLLLFEETGKMRFHEGGRVWKGDSSRPVPLNWKKLKESEKNGTLICFRQFQSSSGEQRIAKRFSKREDKPGFLWIIDIPENFFGARDIQDVAWKSQESETLFPAYSTFRVISLADDECQLLAVESHVREDLES
mmetsp:Transcript_15460/g.27103  ORF Transcript_15460/g.27103 Transcript_15460/m.27103 type:complete len:414 (-) Transcript_15460:34-1275(-)